MATRTPPESLSRHPTLEAEWQTVLAAAITDPAELCRLLDLPPSWAASAGRATGEFPLLVPRTYAARIRPGDPTDPLLLQVLPRKEELEEAPQFTKDPLGEAEATRTPGLLAKYQNRLLMVTTGACPVHCRFCFRRHFPYINLPGMTTRWEAAAKQITADPSIHEVILSGGDPLSVKDGELSRLIERMAAIPHLRRLRVHSRFPVLIPQRVTPGLIAALRSTRLTATVVVHVNHPAEIDVAVAEAFGRLVDAGIPVLSQSVLLRGVNDRVEILAELCERLVDLRVMPYYLHQLDRVAGTAHFEVPETTGRALLAELRTRLPGYAVPRYVRETPHDPSKVVLA
ncbi:MAG: EF-P beta-lysylation protein EpmB [Thermoguttaceae bacterium]